MMEATQNRLPLEEAERMATSWARRAIGIDGHADAQATLAWSMSGSYDLGFERVSVALAIDPNSAWANRVRGTLLVFDGRPSERRDDLLTAVRLNPRHPAGILLYSGIARATRPNRESKASIATSDCYISDFHICSRPPWYGPENYEHLLDGLRKTGWQD